MDVSKSQEKLAEHLEKTLIQKNYWDFMLGRNQITGDYKCRGHRTLFCSRIVLDK